MTAIIDCIICLQKVLGELKARSGELSAVCLRGEELVRAQHPAHIAIQCHLDALTDQWSLVTELTDACLRTHLYNAHEQRKVSYYYLAHKINCLLC